MIIPTLTLSWLCASVNREHEPTISVKVQSFRRERRRQDLYVLETMMDPRVRVFKIKPGDEVRGEPEVELLVDQERQLAAQKIRHTGHGRGQCLRRACDVTTAESAIVGHHVGFHIEQRIFIG